MAQRLTQEERARISAAVAKAEANTAGEIFCVVAERSSDYLHVPFAWGAGAALVVPPLLALAGLDFGAPFHATLGGSWEAAHGEGVEGAQTLAGYVAAQAALFALVTGALFWMPLRLLATPGFRKRAETHRAARAQFLSHGVHVTKARTGVLIYLSQAERVAEIVADEGIYEKVSPEAWSTIVARLAAHAKQGRLADGFVEAIEGCGVLLAEHFPPRSDDVNELNDQIVEL